MRRCSFLVALALGVCAASTTTLAERRVLHDSNLVVDPTLVPEAEAVAYVEVRGATGLRASEPVAGARVRLALVSRASADEAAPARPVPLIAGRTDASGRALLRFRVPRLAAGRYTLQVTTRSQHGADTIERVIEVADSAHLQVRTDRPVYAPGKTLRWRATLVSAANAHPLADAALTVVITDPRGTQVWRGTMSTDEAGMAAGELPLGDDLIFGRYTLTARGRGAEASHAVQIKRFRMPPFAVTLQASGDRARAGDPWRGEVVARYHYGEPVRGRVQIVANDGRVIRRAGTTDADGRFRFELPVAGGAGALRVHAEVTDGAGRTRDETLFVPLPARELRVAIVPESRALTPGALRDVTVLTTDERGALVPALVRLDSDDRAPLVRRSSGALRLRVRTPEVERSWERFEITARASTDDGRIAQASALIALDGATERIRVHRAVVDSGESIELSGAWAPGAGPVVVTLVRHGAPLARTVAEPQGGVLRARITPPPGLFGLFTVRAIELHWDRDTGAIQPRSADTTVYVRPKALQVEITGDTRHRPGDEARLAVEVRAPDGAAVVGAGLAASVVDERILALGPTPPDLLAALRDLHVGAPEAAALSFAALLTGTETDARRDARRAILDSLPRDPTPPEAIIAAARRLARERLRVEQVRPALIAHLVDAGALGRRTAQGWRFDRELHEHARAMGLPGERVQTPWERPTSWAYAQSLDERFEFEPVAVDVSRDRLDALADQLRRHRRRSAGVLHGEPATALLTLAARGLVPPRLGIDAWGRAIQVERKADPDPYVSLISAGPDGQHGTEDDLVVVDLFDEGGLGLSGYGYGAGGGGMASRGARAPSIRVGSASAMGGDEARIRRRFDETVLWATGIRTDARGRAELTVPLADSITGWEVAVEAVGGAGGIGIAKRRLETFLPVHVDAELPETLTTGDRYQVPLAIANHGANARTFQVVVQASGAVELLGAAQQTVQVPAGGARAVRVPIRARRPGEAKLRVSLRAGGVSVDELERVIEVDAPGALVRTLHGGQLTDGAGELRFTVPADHAPGSAKATLTLLRGARDLAIDGLEGMLSEPHGCFEQTSSATYPNLLVLDLLNGAPGAGALRARAESLVAKGYQRLISYEVGGGGFSWFGQAPANQVLTAYGLLEFTDMARVYPVDPKLIERTRHWLLAQQRADGSWRPDPSWLHDWSAVQGKVSTTAYIAWALAESGYRGARLDRALRFLRRHERTLAASPYLLSLWAAAETAANSGDRRALARLRGAARAEGDGARYPAGGATLFYGQGRDADVQVTAMAAQALHRGGQRGESRRALAWLWSQRAPERGWGTTQSTVLALRAAALGTRGAAPDEGTVQVLLDGELVGSLDLASPELLSVPLSANLAAGEHVVALRGPDRAELRADVRLTYRQSGDPAPRADGLDVAIDVPPHPVAVGHLARAEVRLGNPGRDDVAMPTVIVPVPPGFRVEPASLDALEDTAVERAEDRGSEIALYLDRLRPGQTVTLPYRLEAIASCEVRQRPARAYAYYAPRISGSSASARLHARRTGGSPIWWLPLPRQP